MRTVPEFTTNDIRPFFDDGAWGRGLGYARYGHILNAQVDGLRLSADCQGSQPYPYQVGAAWQDGDLHARCSCPIGAYGDCKHVVALLVTWIEHPEEFAQIGNLDDLLTQATPDQLRSALAWVSEEHPQANAGIMRRLMGPEAWTAEMVRQDVVRLMSAAADRDDAYAEGDDGAFAGDGRAGRLPREVVGWCDRGRTCLKAGQSWAAFEIGRGVMLGLQQMQAPRIISDPSHICLVEMMTLLTEILAQTEDMELRVMLAEFLTRVHGWADNAAQRALGDMARQALVIHLDSVERQLAGLAIREELAGKGPYWGGADPSMRQCELLYALLHEQLQNPEELLALAKTLHDVSTQIDALLSLGRLKGALALLKRVDVYGAQRHVAAFARHGQQDAALDWLLARGVGTESYHPWLYDLLREYGRWADLLPVLRERAYESLAGTHVQELREAAQHLGAWEVERNGLISHLEDLGAWATIVELHLADSRHADALDALENVIQEHMHEPLQTYRERVALAVQQDCPMQASLIYAESVELCIARRTRPYYDKAAQWLLRIRDCYQRMDLEDDWFAYLDDLQFEYGNLRALADEMRKAGL